MLLEPHDAAEVGRHRQAGVLDRQRGGGVESAVGLAQPQHRLQGRDHAERHNSEEYWLAHLVPVLCRRYQHHTARSFDAKLRDGLIRAQYDWKEDVRSEELASWNSLRAPPWRHAWHASRRSSDRNHGRRPEREITLEAVHEDTERRDDGQHACQVYDCTGLHCESQHVVRRKRGGFLWQPHSGDADPYQY